jgi:predicted GH43/DUF377 family glycosyl hydrolase
MKATLSALKTDMGALSLFFIIVVLFLAALAVFFWWLRGGEESKKVLLLSRITQNPVLEPIASHWWESQAVFNPAAIVEGGRVHLFYRALGADGISRIGYASSADGVNFDQRLPYPVYAAEHMEEARAHRPFTSPARLTYDTVHYASGGGWGGCEDPRAVNIDGRIYLTFNMFNGWSCMRVAFTSIDLEHLSTAKWLWERFKYLSRPGERQKNWVLFPEKINGKFALFHNLDKGDPSRVHIAYLDTLDASEAPMPQEAPDPQQLPDHQVAWHHRTRSASAPPIKTPQGWLLFYHAAEPKEPHIGYKLGVLLLDLSDPTKVLYRSQNPILEPKEWYENDWKPGVIYASGAVVFGDDLIIYYGGGDKYIAAAKINLNEFLQKLISKENKVY